MAHQQTNRGGLPTQHWYDTAFDSRTAQQGPLHYAGPYEHHLYLSKQQMANETVRLLWSLSQRLEARTGGLIKVQRPRHDTDRERPDLQIKYNFNMATQRDMQSMEEVKLHLGTIRWRTMATGEFRKTNGHMSQSPDNGPGIFHLNPTTTKHQMQPIYADLAMAPEITPPDVTTTNGDHMACSQQQHKGYELFKLNDTTTHTDHKTTLTTIVTCCTPSQTKDSPS